CRNGGGSHLPSAIAGPRRGCGPGWDPRIIHPPPGRQAGSARGRGLTRTQAEVFSGAPHAEGRAAVASRRCSEPQQEVLQRNAEQAALRIPATQLPRHEDPEWRVEAFEKMQDPGRVFRVDSLAELHLEAFLEAVTTYNQKHNS